MIVTKTAPDYRALHRIADATAPQLRSALLRALRDARSRLDIDALLALLQQGNPEALGAFWVALEPDIAAAVRRPLRDAVFSAAIRTSRVHDLGLHFDLTNPNAVAAINTQAATFVQGVTRESRRAIRAILRRGFEDGRTVDQMARDIRAHVGLTERDAVAVSNRRRFMESQGLKPGMVEQRTLAYSERLLRLRGERIARTESIRAMALGQQVAWQEAQQRGLLGFGQKQIWITSPDDRLCELCEAIEDMNADGVPLGQPFASPDGPVLGPPAHPSCRCVLGLLDPSEATG